MTDWISAGQQSNVCGEAHFSQSASTLKSDSTGLTLNFCNALLKKDKKTLSMRIFREHQRRGVSVCVCSGGKSSDSTIIKRSCFLQVRFDVSSLL